MVWKNVPKRSKGPGMWPEQKKLEVLQSFILLGNLRRAAALNNIPEITAKKWKVTAWWKETEDELRRGSKLELSSKLTDLVNSALVVIADRLQDGDFVFNPRTGQFIRKPVSAEHANKIATQLIDRTLAVEKAAKPAQVTDEGLDARLQKLRDEMLRFAKARTIEGEVIDVTNPHVQNTEGETPEVAQLNDATRSQQDDSYSRHPTDRIDSGIQHSPEFGRVEVPLQEGSEG